jgi:hypothetical protein
MDRIDADRRHSAVPVPAEVIVQDEQRKASRRTQTSTGGAVRWLAVVCNATEGLVLNRQVVSETLCLLK